MSATQRLTNEDTLENDECRDVGSKGREEDAKKLNQTPSWVQCSDSKIRHPHSHREEACKKDNNIKKDDDDLNGVNTWDLEEEGEEEKEKQKKRKKEKQKKKQKEEEAAAAAAEEE